MEDKLFFDFNTKAFKLYNKEICTLPQDLQCCWSLSEAFSITSYALLLSEKMKVHKNYIVEKCSNEATYSEGYSFFQLEKQNFAKASYEQKMFISLVFFQGLHYLLSDFSIFPKEEFSFALFYVTWQWYHIAKSMLMVECLPKPEEKNSANIANQNNTTSFSSNSKETEKECENELKEPYPLFHNKLINENFRLAYIAINRLVEDPSYLMMMQQLPINQELDRDQSTLLENVYKYIHAEAEDFSEKTSFTEIIGAVPTENLPLTIHPKFVEHPIQVKNLISQHLLPAYDLETAFQLGKLLKKKQNELKKSRKEKQPQQDAKKAKVITPKPRRYREKWNDFCISIKRFFTSLMFDLLLTLLILIVLPVGGTHIYKHCNFLSADLECKAFCISLAQFIILGFYFFMRVWRPLKNLLVHLLLPRLMAGVLVGYMALVLQEDAYHIPNFIFDISSPVLRCLVIFAFLCACGLLGYFYLRADISQFTRGKKKSIPRKRAVTTLLFATTISLAMGLLALVFMTKHPPEPNHRFWRGPFGWIDPCLMLFYVPLSFLTGLVSQFIFEEKSLTAPTWSAESMN